MMEPKLFHPGLLVTLRLRFDEASGFFELPDALDVHDALDVDMLAGGAQHYDLSYAPLFMDGARDELTRVLDRVPTDATIDLAPYRQASRFTLKFSYDTLPLDPRLLRAVGVEIHMDTVDHETFGRAQEPGAPRSGFIVPTMQNLRLMGVCDEYDVTHDEHGSWITLEGRDLRGIFLDTPADPGLFTKLDLSYPIDDVVRQIVNRHPMLIPVLPSDPTTGGPLNNPNLSPIYPQSSLQSAPGNVLLSSKQAASRKMQIVVAANPAEWPGGIVPSPVSVDGVTRVRTISEETPRTPGQKPRVVPKADPNQVNFWDIITQYCYLCGAIPYFIGQELRIRPANMLYETIKRSGFDSAHPTPFKDGKIRDVMEGDPPHPMPLNIRRLVYGRDIERYQIKRKFNGYRPRVVEVVSLDTSAPKGKQKLLTAQWPSPDDFALNKRVKSGTTDKNGNARTVVIHNVKKRQNQHHKSKHIVTNVSPSGFRTEAEVLRFPVAGINDPDKLSSIAKGLFEELMRGEVSGSVTTKNMASFGGDNGDPDLLRMSPGDPIEFLTDVRPLSKSNPLVATLIKYERASYMNEVRALAKALGGEQPTLGDLNFASLVAATSRRMIDLLSVFRASGVKYVWSPKGMAITVDFQNYLEIRFPTEDPELASLSSDFTLPSDQPELAPLTGESALPPAEQSDATRARARELANFVGSTAQRLTGAGRWGKPRRQ